MGVWSVQNTCSVLNWTTDSLVCSCEQLDQRWNRIYTSRNSLPCEECLALPCESSGPSSSSPTSEVPESPIKRGFCQLTKVGEADLVFRCCGDSRSDNSGSWRRRFKKILEDLEISIVEVGVSERKFPSQLD